VAVIDCHDRVIVGYEFSLRDRRKEAGRARENACRGRFFRNLKEECIWQHAFQDF